jgi:hypothetical protein
MDRLPDELRQESPVVQRAISSLQRAYLAQFANHDPEIGCDGHTLGTGLWRSSWYFLEQGFPGIARRPNGTFFLEFSDYNLYFYRDRPHGTGHRVMGNSEVQRAFLRLNAQICFDFLQNSSVKGKPNLVALHAGIYPVGLTEVGIGLPLTPNDPDTAWFFFEPIFSHKPNIPPSRVEPDKEDHRRFDELDVPEIDIFPEQDSEEDEPGNSV